MLHNFRISGMTAVVDENKSYCVELFLCQDETTSLVTYSHAEKFICNADNWKKMRFFYFSYLFSLG